MRGTEDELRDIAGVARNIAELDKAEDRLHRLIASLPASSLAEEEKRIRRIISSSFLPKRQRRLTQTLDRALVGISSLPEGSTPDVSKPTRASGSFHTAVRSFREELRRDLKELSDSALFQWARYEGFAGHLLGKRVSSALAEGAAREELFAALRDEMARHEVEISGKGFVFQVERRRLSEKRALDKANAGLQRLIDIGIGEYRRQLVHTRSVAQASVARDAVSAWIAGALIGMCQTTLGSTAGAVHLARSWKWWIGATPFLNSRDLNRIIDCSDRSDARDRLCKIVKPLVAALQELATSGGPGGMWMLQNCTLDGRLDRLEVTLASPIKLSDEEVRFHCYMSAERVDMLELESAVNRNMPLVLVPLTEETAAKVWRTDALREAVVDTGKSDTEEQLRGLLSLAVASITAGTGDDRPIRYNYARRFPLDRPDIGADYRVRRRSVETLLDRYESSSGVRLWCSVRRSGKTTSCVDLQAHRGAAVVIAETCQKTGAAHLDDYFYRTVDEAVTAGTRIPDDFIENAIRASAGYDVGKSRLVFVLDEYETLFETLEDAAANREKRRNVVQPILNQLLRFASDNLIVLLGLRPDAFHIIPDQNQLSPYVRPDRFPLFDYAPGNPDCEFRELVKVVLTERVACEEAFYGHLFAETGGHPVLTVNVLTAFFDWLIECERPLSQLTLTGEDFLHFADVHFTPLEMGRRVEYDVLRQLARHSLSDAARDATPWLYAVFHVLRLMASRQMKCRMSDVEKLLGSLGLLERLGLDAQTIVRGGEMANFFELKTKSAVKPRIRLLARLAGSVTAPTRL